MGLDNYQINIQSLLSTEESSVNSIDGYERALEAEMIAKSNNDLQLAAQINFLITKILIDNNVYNVALSRNLKALDYYEKLEIKDQLAQCWKYMAIIYSYLGDYEKQLYYNRKSLNLLVKLDKEPIETIKILNNMGDGYLKSGNLKKAIKYFKNNLNNKNITADLYAASLKNIGIAYLDSNEFDKAKLFIEKALKFAEKEKMTLYINGALYYLGKIYFKKGDFDKALKYSKKSIKDVLQLSISNRNKQKAVKLYIDLLIKKGKTKDLEKYLSIYTDLNRKIKKNIEDRSVRSLQFKFGFTEIEKERSLLEKKNKELKLANQQIVLQKKSIEAKSELLTKANEELKNFAYVISHDIKQPIRIIQSFIGLLELELADVNEQVSHIFDFLKKASTEVNTLVEDVLKYAESGQTNSPLESVDCNEVLQRIERNLASQIDANDKIIYENLPIIKAHSSLILQVFQNLISNSLKFRRKGVTSIVEIKSYRDAKNIYFEISDNGIGIKQENIKKIFNLFTKIDEKSNEGSGIGLSTVLKIIRGYNGKIDIRSELVWRWNNVYYFNA